MPKDAQLALFEAEIRLALELDKPIIVHDRQAHADVYALLKKYRPKGIVPVSYTHLDVYKRQAVPCTPITWLQAPQATA